MIRIAVLFILAIAFLPAQAETQDLSEIKNYFNNPKKIGNGPFTYLGFKVYEANYYVSDDLGKSNFALRLDYVRKVTHDELVRATIKQMTRLGAPETEIQKWQNDLEKMYPDVEEGHHITAIYQPSGATTLIHNGKVLGRIADSQFSKYFFSIWFDTKTNAPDLRAQLLKDLCPPSIVVSNCIK
jgi:Chalcone isomerase-like